LRRKRKRKKKKNVNKTLAIENFRMRTFKTKKAMKLLEITKSRR